MSAELLTNLQFYEVTANERHWILFWMASQKRMGIANISDNSIIYEIELEDIERRNLLPNVASSILETKWKGAFKEEAFGVKKIDEESAVVSYLGRNDVELPRVEESKQREERIGTLIRAFMKAARDTAKFQEENIILKNRLMKHDIPLKSPAKPKRPVPYVNKREALRNRPVTGLQFDDLSDAQDSRE